MNSNDLKKYAKERGADMVGIAAIDRFASLSPDKNPLAIFPECKSVVVLGRRILRGSMRGVEEGTNFNSTYNTFGYNWLENNFLSRTTYEVTCFIEAQGFEGVPLFGYYENGMPKGRPVAPGKPAPNVILDYEFAAHAAGLGEIGLGGFFITPEYGIRQRFAMILTDAELSADPVSAKKICGDCGACAAACPFGAIDLKNKHTAGIPPHTMEVAAVDYEICRACPNGALLGEGRGSRPDRCAAACGRACVARLESNGKLNNKFEFPFRKRTPWVLDKYARPLDTKNNSSAPGMAGCFKQYGKN
ncbi:MAG: 4Fe-4S dicluster domain-containing protein [Kiritimatiellae bacterium]|nr:4Fe-4S dicluster domain-containing protein [Kiritimatiellia bacterium]